MENGLRIDGRRVGESEKDFFRRSCIDWLKTFGSVMVPEYEKKTTKTGERPDREFLRQVEMAFTALHEFPKLEALLGDHLSEHEEARAYRSIGKLIFAGFILGSYGIHPERALPIFQDFQAERARRAREPALEKQKKAIRAECAGMTMQATEKFAESILAGVNKRLADEGEKPVSKRTVARRIADIL